MTHRVAILKFLMVAALTAAALLAGCGDKENLKPSEERTKAESAIMRTAQLVNAYTDRDMAAMTERISSDYKEGYGALLGKLRRDMEAASRVEFEYEIDRVEVMETTVGVVINWRGNWYIGDEKPVEGRGSALFIFKDTEMMPLVDIVGDSPFGIVS